MMMMMRASSCSAFVPSHIACAVMEQVIAFSGRFIRLVVPSFTNCPRLLHLNARSCQIGDDDSSKAHAENAELLLLVHMSEHLSIHHQLSVCPPVDNQRKPSSTFSGFSGFQDSGTCGQCAR